MPSTKGSKSSNPAKRVTEVKSWKKANAAEVLELPSGNICRLRRPGLPALLADGVLPDMLTPIAAKAVESGQAGKNMDQDEVNSEMSTLLKSTDGMAQMFDAFDKITAHCVIEPKVLYHKRVKAAGQIDQIQQSYVKEWEDIPEDARNPDLLYTDEVDIDDKMFIFGFVVGGTRDLERFREELGTAVDSMESFQGSQDNPI